MGGLEGLRVLELGEGVAAAYAAKLMADLGADVLKCEPPGGDRTRRAGPFPRGQEGDGDASGLFLYLNTNKRSRLHDPAELDALAGDADLVVHDLHLRDHGTWGLDTDALRARHPRLVVCSITPFGLTGPYRDLWAEELTVNHGGGWAWLSPGASERPDLPPLMPFGHQASLQAATSAATVALAAVEAARRDGIGDHVDVSVQSHVASMLEAAFIAWTYPGFVADRLGVRTLNPWKIFRCRDGLVFLVAVEQDQWLRLVELMGSPEWAGEEVFATPEARNANADALNLLLEAWTEQQPAEWLWHEGQRRRICTAPVLTMEQVADQPHLRERAFFVEVDQPGAGRVVQPGAPFRLSGGAWQLRRPAPRLDEHAGAGFGPRPPGGAAGATSESTPNRRPGPLDGVRVLDLSWVWAGPFASLQLAHLGADVIKVETGDRLCLGRRLPFHPPGVEPSLNTSGYFNQWNQAKRGLVLDLADPRGLALAKELVAQCDVLVENFAAGVLDRLGLGEAELHRARPDLVVASVTGYGQSGPCRDYMGYGPTAAPLSGLASLTGYPGEGPAEVGIAYGDPAAGIVAAWGVVAALAERARTGQGQRIDVSLWESTLVCQPEGWMAWAMRGEQPERRGNRHPAHAPHGCYRSRPAHDTADSEQAGAWVTIACTSEEGWQGLCTVVGPALGDDPRFATATGRKAHEDDLDRAVEAWTSERDRWETTWALQAAGVAAFPTLSPRDLATDPHLEARGFLERLRHPEVGARTHTGLPWRLTERHDRVRAPAPTLGQHTAEVLADVLGYGPEGVAELVAAGVLR
ncbi:MAG: hypothetical protein GEV08_02365 [Acidimicrobiia bacterium]|nr:hypothetical protein [Acidimicrobiia bacterium]